MSVGHGSSGGVLLYHLPSDELPGCKGHISASLYLQGLTVISGSEWLLISKFNKSENYSLSLFLFSRMSNLLPSLKCFTW